MYTEQEKKIFPYFDGAARVFGDPVTIRRRLTGFLDGNPNAVVDACNSTDPATAMQADEKLLAAIRFAFDMPFDRTTGTGATEDECFAAYDAFTAFMEQKKTSGEPTPTCVPPSEEQDLVPAS
jgi:hypothetical protein